MLYEYKEEELRSFCKNHIESLEKWARIIIDLKLTEIYGNKYFEVTSENKEPIINSKIKQNVEKVMQNSNNKITRKIDALFLDDIVSIVCNPRYYSTCFKEILDNGYPKGPEGARYYLNQLIDIRNQLAHSRPISIREAEKCICYCNDFVDSIKQYYESKGAEKMFNVPNALKATDSLGNEYLLDGSKRPFVIHVLDEKKVERKIFHIGDKYSMWLTMDPSFNQTEYDIVWKYHLKEITRGEKITINIDEKFIGENIAISCDIISKKNWHRFGYFDQNFLLVFTVLPD